MTIDPGGTDEVYGLLRTADLDVALPLSALREVVPHPGTLVALPVRADGLVGALRLRSSVLPVVDLRLLLDHDSEAAPEAPASSGPADRVVVVVAHGGRLLGVAMDDVRGVVRVRDADLVPLAADRTLLVSAAFQHGEQGDVVSVLNAALLLALPGVPTVPEVAIDETVSSATTSLGPATGAGQHLTVVRSGERRLALGLEHLRAMIDLTDLRPGLLTGGHCLGTVVHGGMELSVLDPLSVLGLPADRSGPPAVGVVLDLGPGSVVLAASALDRLLPPGAAPLPLPAWATRRADLVRHVVEVDDGPCLVVDADALRADPELLSYAALATQADDAEVATDDGPVVGAAVGAPTYLTYVVGGRTVATPLEQVLEILPPPAVATASGVAGVDGIVVHRGRTVPLVGLADLLVPETAVPGTCLLLVEADGEPVAFAVDHLGAIRPRVWADPEPAQRVVGAAAPSLRECPLVRVADLDRLVPDLDLIGLARRVSHPTVPEGSLRADLHQRDAVTSPAA